MRNINVRNLFIAACLLKVASALAGWHFNSPWILGFAVPLVVMLGYMWLGATRRNAEVSGEKFADSCYYLGFIFTIASISVALMDLPNIGIHIQDIAVRFGAAMLSTVLGLSVRVAMVTFRQDMGDAIQNAQEGVVEASLRFRDQLGGALDRLSSFELAVDQATRLSVERVNFQVENLSKNHADRLTQFFATLTKGNQEAFGLALEEVKVASTRLSESVDGYALSMRSNLSSIEAKVVAFSDAVTHRLKNTTFPDDYFAKHLQHPLGQLKSAADEVHTHIIGASETFGESTEVLALALKKLRIKASTTESTLESVAKLATQQQLMMEGAQGQVDRLEGLGTTLQGLDHALERAVQGLEHAKDRDALLNDAIRSVVADSRAGRKEVQDWLKQAADDLVAATEDQYENLDQARASLQSAAETYAALAARMSAATEAASSKLLEGANANLHVADRLADSAIKTETAAGRLQDIAAVDVRVVGTLSALAETATAGLKRVDDAVEQLQSIARHLSTMETSSRRNDLRDDSTQIVQANAISSELPMIMLARNSSIAQPPFFEQPIGTIGQSHVDQTHGASNVGYEFAPIVSGTQPRPPGASEILVSRPVS
jgi:uncharacterized phage infection (PIP) family protein YhgE